MHFPAVPTMLIVFTSANLTMRYTPTGWYLPEIADAYYCLDPHVKMDFASPKGPNPPVDPKSVVDWVNDPDSMHFMNDTKVQRKLAHAIKLQDVKVKDYDAIYYVGGLGAAVDLGNNTASARVATEFWQSGKLVTGICHGPAGLVHAVDRRGKSIFAGRKCTTFSNDEERDANQVEDVPFLVESRVRELGCIFQQAPTLGGSMVVKDGRLITGENPASAKLLGNTILKALTGKTCM
ncbi:ThiJ/PfpI [Crepidotus variabilis]|uniref:D-lactate dehydratase n=1 Tax=Crepidotus variabilis TaxID=179855 RepID=A0A9P6EU02_9AGAR|nr:ThiJ/PfpI [Crepidotus variabilis]